MKLVLGGSAVFATALLTASFVFYVPPTPALTKTVLRQEIKQEQKDQNQKQQINNKNKQTENSDKETTSKETVNKEKNDNKTANSNDTSNSNGKDNKSTESAAENLSKTEHYSATAYALRGRTATGRSVARGIIAADPRVLPLGSRVRIEAGNWSGEYLVADTGGKIKGKKIDIWVPNSGEAIRFGRRTVKLIVLSYGNKPKPKNSINNLNLTRPKKSQAKN